MRVSAKSDYALRALIEMTSRADAAAVSAEQLGKRQFLVGDAVTLADFVVAGSATYMERGRFPTAGLPHLHAWWKRLHQIPAWKETIPSADLPK